MTEKSYIVIGVALAVIAALLMINGQVLGEATINLSRILLITALPFIVKGQKSRASTSTDRGTA